MDEKFGIASPWAIYAGRAAALFERDEEVLVAYDNDAPKLTLYVDREAKADAIRALLPMRMVYGNVALEISVVPSNSKPSEAELYRTAFEGNPILEDVVEGFGPAGDIAYALFAPEAVQLREDDISEYNGLTTMTAAELAESVLGHGMVLVSSAPKTQG